MKLIITIILIILITACAPKVEVEKAKPAEQEKTQIEQPSPPPAPEELVEQKETAKEEEAVIEIMPNSLHGYFSPNEKVIPINTKVKWVNKDEKEHKISCYRGGERVATSPNLKEGESFTYKFSDFTGFGEYICLDAIYGIRSTIKVEIKSLISPTGNVVMQNKSLEGASISAIAVTAVIILLLFIYGRKRKS